MRASRPTRFGLALGLGLCLNAAVETGMVVNPVAADESPVLPTHPGSQAGKALPFLDMPTRDTIAAISIRAPIVPDFTATDLPEPPAFLPRLFASDTVAVPAGPTRRSALAPIADPTAGAGSIDARSLDAPPANAARPVLVREPFPAPPTAAQPIELVKERIAQALDREAEQLAFGEMRVARGIVEAVQRAAERTGADPVYLMALADKESSLRPTVSASTSSAEGLFQFIEQTWLDCLYKFGPRHGLAREAAAIVRGPDGRYSITDDALRAEILQLRRDPLLAAVMAGEMLGRDRATIEAELGRALAPHELYIIHFLGAGGAARFLALKDESPKVAAAKTFGAAARANRTIFYDRGRRGRPLTVAEVDARFEAMIGTRLARYVELGGEDAAQTLVASAEEPPTRRPLSERLAELREDRTEAAYSALHMEGEDAEDGPLPVPLPPPRPAD